jgi:hypothetical protein
MNSKVPTQRFGPGSQHVSHVGQGTWMVESSPEQAVSALLAKAHGWLNPHLSKQ